MSDEGGFDSAASPGGSPNLKQATVSGMLWTGVGKASIAILQILVLAVLARLLTPTDFGIISAALVITLLAERFSRLGLGQALIQRKHLDAAHIEVAFAFTLLLGVLLGAVVWITAPQAASFFGISEVDPVLRVLAWLFPLSASGAVAQSMGTRNLEFAWLVRVEVVAFSLGYGVLGITTAFAGWGVWALVAGHLGRAVLRMVMLLLRYPPKLTMLPRWAPLRDLLAFGGMFTVGQLGTYAAVQGDNLVVGRWLGPAALGLYSRAYQLTTRPALLLGDVLDRVLFPTLSRIQDERARLRSAYRRALSACAFVVLPISVVLAVLGRPVIGILLGPQWDAAVVPFQIMAATIFFRISARVSGSIAKATGAVTSRAWRAWTFALLVVAGVWVGQHWGIEGAALGLAGALIVNWLLMSELGLKTAQGRWSVFRRAHGPAVRLAVVAGATSWIVLTSLQHAGVGPVGTFLAAGFAAGGLSLLMARLVPAWFVGEEGIWLIQTLRSFVADARAKRHRRLTAMPET